MVRKSPLKFLRKVVSDNQHEEKRDEQEKQASSSNLLKT